MKKYLDSIKNVSTKKIIITTLAQLKDYSKEIDKDFKKFNSNDIDGFLRDNFTNHSLTFAISKATNLKSIYKYLNSNEANHLTKHYLKTRFTFNEEKLYTPFEMFNIIESLKNAQDKCLVLLLYLGLYDSGFNTIRNLKESDLKGNILYLDNCRYITLSDYAVNIIKTAIREKTYYLYDKKQEDAFIIKDLNPYTNHIIKSIHNSKSSNIVSSIFISKRIETFADYIEDIDFTPVAIKNSKIIYDLTYIEYLQEKPLPYEDALKYFKDNNITGSLSQLRLIKKSYDKTITDEIKENKDFIFRNISS